MKRRHLVQYDLQDLRVVCPCGSRLFRIRRGWQWAWFDVALGCNDYHAERADDFGDGRLGHLRVYAAGLIDTCGDFQLRSVLVDEGGDLALNAQQNRNWTWHCADCGRRGWLEVHAGRVEPRFARRRRSLKALRLRCHPIRHG